MGDKQPIIEPPDLIPDQLSPDNSQWLSEQLQKAQEHKRLLSARAIVNMAEDPRNIRAY